MNKIIIQKTIVKYCDIGKRKGNCPYHIVINLQASCTKKHSKKIIGKDFPVDSNFPYWCPLEDE